MTIPAKLIQMSARVTTKPVTNTINLTIQTGTYQELLKTATVSPVLKNEDTLSKENYRPISVLTVFSKIFERYYLRDWSLLIPGTRAEGNIIFSPKNS